MAQSSVARVKVTDDTIFQCDPTSNYNLETPYHTEDFSDAHPELRGYYRPHGLLARTLYYKSLADEKLQTIDRNQWYQCSTENLPETVQHRFVPLFCDLETESFLEQAYQKSDWIFTQLWHSVAKSILGWFMTQTSINGLLGRGSMFVFSLEQFRGLLDLDVDCPRGSLLDLGAGDGCTTEVIAPLFRDVYVTEISAPMRWILSKKGFQLLEVETWANSEATFDVITCLNLLDRCDRPLTLLKDLRMRLNPDGRIIIALVLPFNPYVETGSMDHKPTECLPIEGRSFEQQVTSFIRDVVEQAGYQVLRWSRVPYLCEGDLNQAYYWLDDAIFVLKVHPDNLVQESS